MNTFTEQINQAKQLSEMWTAFVDGHLPTQRQFLVWLTMYDRTIIEKAIQRMGVWSQRFPGKPDDEYVRYASGIMAGEKRKITGASYDGREVSRG